MVSTDIRILPMLMGVGLFIVFVGLFYTTYTPTGKAYENQMQQLEYEAQYGTGYQQLFSQIMGETSRVAINDEATLEGVYDGNAGPHYIVTNFIWADTTTFFELTAERDNAGDINLSIITFSTDDKYTEVGTVWNRISNGDSYRIGQGWFAAGATSAFLTSLPVPNINSNIWDDIVQVGETIVLKNPITWPVSATYEQVHNIYHYLTVKGITNVTSAWPYDVNVHVENIRQSAGTDNGVWGYMDVTFSPYSSSSTGVITQAVTDALNDIKGVVAGMFGAVFGDYGKQFVNTLSSVLTMDFPGMPTTIRAIIAVPLNLAIIFIIIGVIALFIPKVF